MSKSFEGCVLDFRRSEYPYLEEVNEGILKQVKRVLTHPARILDVGAGRGILGAELKKLGHQVTAIEWDKTANLSAQGALGHVVHADLCDIAQVREGLQGSIFHAIIFSDVLEHVYDPLGVLRNYLPFLEEGGKIFISLPNATNWLNRLRFFFGRFDYEMTGVMDRTHLRFFTFHSAKQLMRAGSCQIERVDCTPFLIRAVLPEIKALFKWKYKGSLSSREIVDSKLYGFYQKWIYPLEYGVSRIFPSLLSFRMIFVISKTEKTKDSINEC
jgi:SAM-dependent methyltransferase